MTLLAIESATDMVGVGLFRDDGASAERIHVGGRAHAELLAPAIEEVCAVSGCTVADDIDAMAVDVGPGLFTGLRVGVATAKALAQALGIGVLGVSSLDVLAAAAAERFGPGPPERVVSVIDARGARCSPPRTGSTGSDGGPAATRPIDPEAVRVDRSEPIAPEALVAWLPDQAGGGRTRSPVVGDGAVRYRQLLVARPPSTCGGRTSCPPRLPWPWPVWPGTAWPGATPGRHPRTWRPTTAARPTPASIGSSGPPGARLPGPARVPP